MANPIHENTPLSALEGIQRRLDEIDGKLDRLHLGKRKSMEWIAVMSEHIGTLNAFREEVRASLEPLFSKLDAFDEKLRILRHATSDVSRRIESLEITRKAS